MTRHKTISGKNLEIWKVSIDSFISINIIANKVSTSINTILLLWSSSPHIVQTRWHIWRENHRAKLQVNNRTRLPNYVKINKYREAKTELNWNNSSIFPKNSVFHNNCSNINLVSTQKQKLSKLTEKSVMESLLYGNNCSGALFSGCK